MLLYYAPHINVYGGDFLLKLLIAIRSAVIADSLASTLSKYDVHICHTGADALIMLEILQPDILLVDLFLPVMDGLTLLRRSRYKPARILALTNLATPAALQAAADAGVQDVLLLPCAVQHIVKHLDDLIEKAPSPES